MSDEQNGKAWTRLLSSILWGVCVAFAGLCITGFFNLDTKIRYVEASAYARQERIVRLEECVLMVKSDMSLMKSDIREILRVVSKDAN